MLIAALIGFAFGFVGSMPIAGPIAVLIFARGIDGRFKDAILIGAGSVLAETAYAFLAFWGFSKLLTQYDWLEPVSRGAAALILIGLGVVFIRRKQEADPPDPDSIGRANAGSFLLGLSVSGLNPTLLATWSGAATTLFSTGLVEFESSLAIPFGLGAGAGIMSWYVILVWLIRRYKDRFKRETLNRVIQVFGVFLLAVAGWFVWRLVEWLTQSA